jgi:diacylglycerol kinase (ATP)
MQTEGVLIYNPRSGRKRGMKRADRFLGLWQRELEIPLILRPTESLADLQQAVNRIDLVRQIPIFMGGDGTLSEGMHWLFRRNDYHRLESPVGFLPAGSGNSFLYDFGVAQESKAAQALVSAIKKREIMRVDAGILTYQKKQGLAAQKRAVINIWGVGLVARIADLAMRMRYLGRWNYTLATLLETWRHKPMTLEWSQESRDGETMERCLEADFVTLSNSRYTGGAMMMAPDVRVNDGRLCLVVSRLLDRLKILGVFPKIFAGKHVHLPRVESEFVSQKVRFFLAEPTLMLVDGEVFAGLNPSLEIKEGYWSLYMPQAYQKQALSKAGE